ncbi:MAG: DUF4292 domain-containing protein [Planctomycetes bacterium]|nr:DUF4292 domain-containing protein [Planctomycetota bacterium]
MTIAGIRGPTAVLGGILVALLALAIAGCAHPVRPQAPGDATALAAAVARVHGQAPALAADLIIVVTDAAGEATTFQVNVWRAADGRVRLLASKLDVDFCTALLTAEGLTAWLPRARVMTDPTVEDASPAAEETAPAAEPTAAPARAQPWLRDLALLAAELADGPVPMTGPYVLGERPHTLRCPAGDLTMELQVDPATHEAIEKRLVRADGSRAATLTYDRYRAFDDCRRATRLRLSVPDGAGTTTVVLRAFSSVGAISDERMRLDIPKGIRRVPMREFLERMGD